MTSTKPVYRKPTSKPQRKSRGPAGFCKWMPQSMKTLCSSQFLLTYFQLLHLENSEKWSRYLFTKTVMILLAPSCLLPVKSGSRLKQLHALIKPALISPGLVRTEVGRAVL